MTEKTKCVFCDKDYETRLEARDVLMPVCHYHGNMVKAYTLEKVHEILKDINVRRE